MHGHPHLFRLLHGLRTRFMEEAAYVRRALDYIVERPGPEIYVRATQPLHVTASAWVVSPERDRVLLLHHRKLDQWFQPGGDADGDPDVWRVALKECEEETGLPGEAMRLASPELLDFDIHTTPPLPGVPAHGHLDFRFLVEVDDHLEIPSNSESHAVI